FTSTRRCRRAQATLFTAVAENDIATFVFHLMIRRPPTSPLFPYPTLFRSAHPGWAGSHRGPRSGAELGCAEPLPGPPGRPRGAVDRKSTRLNSSHVATSYAVFCLKKKSSEPLRAWCVRQHASLADTFSLAT